MGHIFSEFQADNLSEEIRDVAKYRRVDRRVDKSLNTVSLYPRAKRLLLYVTFKLKTSTLTSTSAFGMSLAKLAL